MKKKSSPPSRITRHDNETSRTHAWRVTLQRHGLVQTKTFSDAVWGGKRAAQQAARAFLDQWLDHGDEVDHRLWRRNKLRKNNRSGIAGVARHVVQPPENKGSGRPFVYWCARWTDEHDNTKVRKFSVNRWGEEGAREKALKMREEQVLKAVEARLAMRKRGDEIEE